MAHGAHHVGGRARAIGWQLTGNVDMHVAGLSFAGLLLIALVAALAGLERSR